MNEKEKPKSRSTALTVVGVILCIVFIPIIIINLTLIVKTYTQPDHIPDVFGIKPVICLSGSMSPEFNAGDLIFIKKVDTSTLEEGDVICYQSEGKAVTHRIMKVVTEDGETKYITRGDANNAEDRLTVSQKDVEGQYMGTKVAGLGNGAMFMQSTTGMIVFIICPLVLFILYDIIRRKFTRKKETSEAAKLEEEVARLRAQVEEAKAK